MSKYLDDECLPIENYLYSDLNQKLSTFLYEKLHMTPNIITTVTLLLSFVIGWNLWNNNIYTACGLVLFRQILDSADGFVARKYNLKSKFGEIYDNISDHVNTILMTIILGYKGRKLIFNNLLIFIVCFLIGMTYFKNIIDLRNDCLKNKGDCSDPRIKHSILKSTRIFSLYELTVLWCVLIIIFSTYIK